MKKRNENLDDSFNFGDAFETKAVMRSRQRNINIKNIRDEGSTVYIAFTAFTTYTSYTAFTAFTA